jgi:hypothetical protein
LKTSWPVLLIACGGPLLKGFIGLLSAVDVVLHQPKGFGKKPVVGLGMMRGQRVDQRDRLTGSFVNDLLIAISAKSIGAEEQVTLP